MINFETNKCIIIDCANNNIIYTSNRTANVYIIDIVSSVNISNCLVAKMIASSGFGIED